jgi:hypothetical protein
MLHGECNQPVSVIAFDERAGWARDASEDIARKIVDEADRRGVKLPKNTQAFVERNVGSPSIIPLVPRVDPIEELRAALAMIRGALAAVGGPVLSKELPTSEQAELLAKGIRTLADEREFERQKATALAEKIRSGRRPQRQDSPGGSPPGL